MTAPVAFDVVHGQDLVVDGDVVLFGASRIEFEVSETDRKVLHTSLRAAANGTTTPDYTTTCGVALIQAAPLEPRFVRLMVATYDPYGNPVTIASVLSRSGARHLADYLVSR